MLDNEFVIAFSIAELRRSRNYTELSSRFGVPKGLLYRWANLYSGYTVSEIRSIRQLKRENAEMRRHIDYLLCERALVIRIRSTGAL
jgi:transposase-like protein